MKNAQKRKVRTIHCLRLLLETLEELDVVGGVEVAGKSERKGNLPNFY